MTGFVAAALVAVQMSLDCGRNGCAVARDVVVEDVLGGYEAASVVAIAGGVSTIVINATSAVPSRAAGWFGVAAGALGVGLFFGARNQGEEYVPLRTLNGVVGLVSLVVGFNALARPGASAEPASVTAAPWRGRRGATGMQVRVSF